MNVVDTTKLQSCVSVVSSGFETLAHHLERERREREREGEGEIGGERERTNTEKEEGESVSSLAVHAAPYDQQRADEGALHHARAFVPK